MITEFVERFEAAKPQLRANMIARFEGNQYAYDDAAALFKSLVEVLDTSDTWDWNIPDPDRITRIDHGDYQGTEVFVVAAKGYQPHRHWAMSWGYGSCSGCDALQAVAYDYSGAEAKADALLGFMLNMVQSMVEIQ